MIIINVSSGFKLLTSSLTREAALVGHNPPPVTFIILSFSAASSKTLKARIIRII